MHQDTSCFSNSDLMEKSYTDSAYNALPFAICTLDDQLNIIWSNNKFQKIAPRTDEISFEKNLHSLDITSRKKIGNLFSGKSKCEHIFLNEHHINDLPFSFKIIHRVLEKYATFLISKTETFEQVLDKSQLRLQSKYGLSFAETTIAKLLTLGNSTAEIAELRNVSIATVRAQLRQLREKMAVRTSLEIVTKTFRNHIENGDNLSSTYSK